MANLMVGDLVKLLQDCELSEEIIAWMRDTSGIRCVRHLAHWCSHISEVDEVIYQKLPMPPNHMVLSNLRAAWTAASRKNQHLEGNRALAIHEADMNAPLDTGSRNALQTAWRAQPIIELPATWQAPEGCVGAYYRALERRTITAEPVKGLAMWSRYPPSKISPTRGISVRCRW